MNYSSYVILLILMLPVTSALSQNCEMDTTRDKVVRFYPDFPENDPLEGYQYRFDTLMNGTWKQYRSNSAQVYKIWTILNGRLQGAITYFNGWGEQVSTECYDMGILSSVSNYHSNGFVSDLWVYNKDSELVLRKSWYPNGVLSINATKTMQTRWRDNGSLWVKRMFENNSLSRVQLFGDESELLYQGFWSNLRPINERQFLYKKGRMTKVSYNSLKADFRKIIEANDLNK